MKAQEVANLAWSLAVLGKADEDLVTSLLRSAQEQRSELLDLEMHQLYQVC